MNSLLTIVQSTQDASVLEAVVKGDASVVGVLQLSDSRTSLRS